MLLSVCRYCLVGRKAKARRWASNLAKRIDLYMQSGETTLEQVPEIELMDERLTTVSAHRQLRQANIAERGHRPVVDQQSAVVILQAALDKRNSREK